MTKGDTVAITGGKFEGRTGTYKKPCSAAFSEYCWVKLDLKPRERGDKNEMILIEHIQLTPKTN